MKPQRVPFRDVSNVAEPLSSSISSGVVGTTNITVVDQQHRKRYRMALKGNDAYVKHLSIDKLKHHLAAGSCPIPPEEQILYILSGNKNNNKEKIQLPNLGLAKDYGIQNGSTLYVVRRSSADQQASYHNHNNTSVDGLQPPHRSHSSFVAPHIDTTTQHHDTSILQQLPAFGGGENELSSVLRQQKLLEEQRSRRMSQFEQQTQDLLQASQAASMKQSNLEEQSRVATAQAKLLEEAVAQAAAEQKRLADVREKEEQFEAARSEDLAARTEQLHQEQLKMKELQLLQVSYARQKLKMQQEREEFEAEQERLQKEREALHQQYLADQLNIRQEEVSVENQLIEAERRRQELVLERTILAEQRSRSLGHHHAGHPNSSRVNFNTSATHPHPVNHPASVNVSSHDLTASVTAKGTTPPPPAATQHRAISSSSSPVVSEMTGPSKSAPRMSFQEENVVPVQPLDVRAKVALQLQTLADHLQLPSLELDHGNRCKFSCKPSDLSTSSLVMMQHQHAVTISAEFDETSEQLHLQVPILTHLPERTASEYEHVMFRLYEALLVGKKERGCDMGVDLERNYVWLSISVHVPTSHRLILSHLTPRFVESALAWRKKLADILLEAETSAPSQKVTRRTSPSSSLDHQIGHGAPRDVHSAPAQQRSSPYSLRGRAHDESPRERQREGNDGSSSSTRYDSRRRMRDYDESLVSRTHSHNVSLSESASQLRRRQLRPGHQGDVAGGEESFRGRSGSRGRGDSRRGVEAVQQPRPPLSPARLPADNSVEIVRTEDVSASAGGGSTSRDKKISGPVGTTSALWREYNLLREARTGHNTSSGSAAMSASASSHNLSAVTGTGGSPRTGGGVVSDGYVSPLTDVSTHRGSTGGPAERDRNTITVKREATVELDRSRNSQSRSSHRADTTSTSRSPITTHREVTADQSQSATRSQSAGRMAPYLGMEVVDGDEWSEGVSVVSVKGPAMRAGLKAGDMVIAVEGYRIATLDDFYHCMTPHQRPDVPLLQPNRVTVLTVVREGVGKMNLDVLVGAQTLGGSPTIVSTAAGGTSVAGGGASFSGSSDHHQTYTAHNPPPPRQVSSSAGGGGAVRQLQFEAQIADVDRS